jgi:hypothetical protein
MNNAIVSDITICKVVLNIVPVLHFFGFLI